jgi:hypothetical protein
MCFRISWAVLLLGAVAGERFRVDDMQAVLVNATRHGDRLEPVLLWATLQPSSGFGYETFDFERGRSVNDWKACALMQQLGALTEWEAFLSQVNGVLKSGDQIAQNSQGKHLAAGFNTAAHSQGKLQGWKVTFFSKFMRVDNARNPGFRAMHFLVIEPQSSYQFHEKHAGFAGEWDRACCCKDASESACQHSWSDGKCCKFKYGDISKNGCSSGGLTSWLFSSSPDPVEGAKCWAEPEAPFGGWKYAEMLCPGSSLCSRSKDQPGPSRCFCDASVLDN